MKFLIALTIVSATNVAFARSHFNILSFKDSLQSAYNPDEIRITSEPKKLRKFSLFEFLGPHGMDHTTDVKLQFSLVFGVTTYNFNCKRITQLSSDAEGKRYLLGACFVDKGDDTEISKEEYSSRYFPSQNQIVDLEYLKNIYRAQN